MESSRKSVGDNFNIFVSYSWDSIEHRMQVKEFISKLRSDGFDVIYDDDMSLGDRITTFMENSVDKSNLVFLFAHQPINIKPIVELAALDMKTQ